MARADGQRAVGLRKAEDDSDDDDDDKKGSPSIVPGLLPIGTAVPNWRG